MRYVFLFSILCFFLGSGAQAYAASRSLHPTQVRTLFESTGGATDGVMQLGNASGTSSRQWVSAFFDWSSISSYANIQAARLEIASTGGNGDCSVEFSAHASLSPWNITNSWDGHPNGLAMASSQTITCASQTTVEFINLLELQHVRVNGLVIKSIHNGTNENIVTIDPNSLGLVIDYTVTGDANDDGKVEEQDYAVWLLHFGQSVTGVSNGDFNGEGKVDGVDYVVWLKNYEY